MARGSLLLVLLAAALLLTAVAWSRGAEYDEQYTLFLTGGTARPAWPDGIVTAGAVQDLQAGHASASAIARDLRATDVHPPLYFWAIAAWRRLLGDSLFTARLASVLCSIATLGSVAAIARAAALPVLPAVLLTVGCYGFAYTGTIARGFALAQMLSVTGIAVLLAGSTSAGVRHRGWGRSFAGGLLLGAATGANYLAAFVACAVLLHATIAVRPACRVLAIAAGFALWLPIDLWFFLAQRHSRTGQFAQFEALPALLRLARYAAANLFGGLPLYMEGGVRVAIAVALVLLLAGLIVQIVRRWRHIATPDTRRLFAMAAVAPPIGLMLLGLAFDNAPIELRYLAFATPFVALLLAGALTRPAMAMILAVQAVALWGLMTRPETMQPARAAAAEAAALVQEGVVMLPRGNDGVGIVGAFAGEASSSLRLLVIPPDIDAAAIRARAAPSRRVVLVLLGQDETSRATLPVLQAAFTGPCWRVAGQGTHVLAVRRVCDAE
ncbi:MAG: glycosyltransferase family 39 protein [Acetobacteraceae bacterium]